MLVTEASNKAVYQRAIALMSRGEDNDQHSGQVSMGRLKSSCLSHDWPKHSRLVECFTSSRQLEASITIEAVHGGISASCPPVTVAASHPARSNVQFQCRTKVRDIKQWLVL